MRLEYAGSFILSPGNNLQSSPARHITPPVNMPFNTEGGITANMPFSTEGGITANMLCNPDRVFKVYLVPAKPATSLVETPSHTSIRERPQQVKFFIHYNACQSSQCQTPPESRPFLVPK